MDFPIYTPVVVREHITALIEGSSWTKHGWGTSLAKAELSLAALRKEIDTKTGKSSSEQRQQIVDASNHVDALSESVDCLKRLASDERMQKVFERLATEFTNDKKWCDFIDTAFDAHINFSKYREQLKRVAELKENVANTAEKLAKLIRQLSEIGQVPSAFHSIPYLLENTDNTKARNHNLQMWRSMRRYILGINTRNGEDNKLEGNKISLPEFNIHFVSPGDSVKIDPDEERINTLIYAWNTAPDLADLLDTVAKDGRNFKPSETGMIEAAINSRQKNTKTEYLRAFGYSWHTVKNNELTPSIMHAIAITADVVLNLPDCSVTYDDARKTLKAKQ